MPCRAAPGARGYACIHPCVRARLGPATAPTRARVRVRDGWAARHLHLRSAVIKAFKALGSLTEEVQDDDVVEKCQLLCQEHGLSPTDLAYKWEAHVDKVCVCAPASCRVCAVSRERTPSGPRLRCVPGRRPC